MTSATRGPFSCDQLAEAAIAQASVTHSRKNRICFSAPRRTRPGCHQSGFARATGWFPGESQLSFEVQPGRHCSHADTVGQLDCDVWSTPTNLFLALRLGLPAW